MPIVWILGALAVYYVAVHGKGGTLLQGPTTSKAPPGVPAKPGSQVSHVNLSDVQAGAALGSGILQALGSIFNSSTQNTASIKTGSYQDTTQAANVLADSGINLDALNLELTPQARDSVSLTTSTGDSPNSGFDFTTAGVGVGDYSSPTEYAGGTDGLVSVEGFTS